MSTKSYKSMAGVLTLAGASCFLTTMQAQPMYDRIHVNLPYKVTLQNKTIPPGDYTIQQLPSASGESRILLFYTNDGMKFETSAMTIPALELNTPTDTKVVLNHVGEDYYISKIWVQGKDYGYELPMPEMLKGRQNERISESTVAGTNQPSANTDMNTSSSAAVVTPPPAASTEPSTAANTPSTAPAMTASNDNSQAAQPSTPPAMQSATTDSSANRAMPEQTPTPAVDNSSTSSADRSSMPATAAGWLTMLLSGGTLSGAGLMLRRKR